MSVIAYTKHMKKTLLIAFPILLIIGIAAGVYFTYFTPSAQARHIAEQTMQAASTQQSGAFKSYGTPQGGDAFYSAAASRNYKLTSFTQSGDAYYALYTFTDNTSPRLSRIGVSGGHVTAVATGDNLAALPQNDPKQTANQATTKTCLAKEDLKYLDSTNLYAKTFRGATMIFADDTSTNYSGEENATKLLDRMGDFYKATKSKDYTFLVRGYLAASPDTLDQRKQVIQNRTTKIQQDLISRGIAEDRINIGEPVAYPLDQTRDEQNERYVIIDITNSCAS